MSLGILDAEEAARPIERTHGEQTGLHERSLPRLVCRARTFRSCSARAERVSYYPRLTVRLSVMSNTSSSLIHTLTLMTCFPGKSGARLTA